MDEHLLYVKISYIIQKYYKPKNFCINLTDNNLADYHISKKDLNNLVYSLDVDPDCNLTVHKGIIHSTALGLPIKKILLRSLTNNNIAIKCPRHKLYDLKTIKNSIDTCFTLDPATFYKQLEELLIYGGFINSYDAIIELREFVCNHTA